jgi:peptidoglycan/LPS O-acetylase OafA/YrhL
MTADEYRTRRPTLEALTGLRFVAAMAVVLYHVPLGAGTPDLIVRILSRGYLGVSLFFVLSGFILTYTYIDPDSRALRGSPRAFWWARIARIYPVYAAALLISLPIFIVFRIVIAAPAERPGALLSATLTPLLLQSWWPSAATQWNTPGWSLSVELFFYAIFPVAAVWLARRPNAMRASLVVWAACLIPASVYVAATSATDGAAPRFDHYFWLQVVKFNPVTHLGELAVGVAAGLAFIRRGTGSVSSLRALSWIVPIALGIAALTVVGTDRVPYALCHSGLLAPLWAVVILRLASNAGPVARLLGSQFLVRLGEASYALYLVHSPLLGYQRLLRGFFRVRYPDLSVPSAVGLVAFLAIALGLSFLLFRRVEEPARRWIRARTLEGTAPGGRTPSRADWPAIHLKRPRRAGAAPEILATDE